MPYDERLAARIRKALANTKGITERQMFGGVGFLLKGNMCVGVWKESLVARIDPEDYPDMLERPHVKPFDITGRPMSGWILVDAAGCSGSRNLGAWLDRASAYVSALPARTK